MARPISPLTPARVSARSRLVMVLLVLRAVGKRLNGGWQAVGGRLAGGNPRACRAVRRALPPCPTLHPWLP
jgi:hypothetical protein